MKYPKISVLIGAFKEEDVIGNTLKHLTEEVEYPNLEIIVGVDTQEDRTLDIAKYYAKRNKNIIIDYSPVRRGMQNAMNSMLRKAKGDIIVKCDADFKYLNPKKVFFKLAKHYENPKIGGVIFKTRFDKKELNRELKKGLAARGEALISLVVSDWREKKLKEVEGDYRLLGGCDSFRRSLVPRLDPNIFNDEIEFFYEVLKKGYKIIFAKDICRYGTSLVPNVRSLYLQKRRSAYGLFKVSNKRNIKLFKYYLSILGFLISNITKYNIRDLVALFYLGSVFLVSNLDARLKYLKGGKSNIWVRYKRN